MYWDDYQRNSGQRSSRSQLVVKNTHTLRNDDHVSRTNTLSQNQSISSNNGDESCFACSKHVGSDRNSRTVIPCSKHHKYCMQCLDKIVNEHIEQEREPTCFPPVCIYELSRYEVLSLPINENLMTNLLKFVTNEQRPQCCLCQFYINVEERSDYQKHVTSCDIGNRSPCQYCQCLYLANELDSHRKQCQELSVSQRKQALVNFVSTRTKYPFKPVQIRHFIDKHRKHGEILTSQMLVDELAKYGAKYPYELPTLVCGICAETCFCEDIFVFGCNECHKLCYDCFAASCENQKNENRILTCPLCDYQLQNGELKYLRISDEEKKNYFTYQQEKTFAVYISNTPNIIRCPNQNCKWGIEIDDPDERIGIRCKKCNTEFCSTCGLQFHYRTTCEQVPKITQYWYMWCNTERVRYLRARALDDARFEVQLNQYERQKAENAQRNEELRLRYEELVADEAFKARNFRLCPKCQRVIEHREGCDFMVCGRDYHGNNKLAGCGANFEWSKAQRYKSDIGMGPAYIMDNLLGPERQKTFVHIGIKCNACNNDVEGIRFDCIHCLSLTYCEKCEQQGTLSHSNDLRNQNKQQHVFQLITS